ncbi:fatty acid cis/trans isomerase [Colwelliaceae bacterium MEBiC 14330]
MSKFNWLFIFLLFSGCATIGVMEYDKLYGASNVNNRLSQAKPSSEQAYHFQQKVKPIIENRCVVCHGCYDAPCQLKMESPAGIIRGANKVKVYNGERLLTANITENINSYTNLNVENLQAMRQQGFFPVLNERQQSPQANAQSSLLYQMLALKKAHPLPEDTLLDDSFDISLDRNQQCPTIEEFEQYQQKYPLAGMPYGLPGLSDNEHALLSDWLVQGAIMPEPSVANESEQIMIDQWEKRLNNSALKSQLIARYLYEHLYLANLYFDSAQTNYFTLVRSSTPSGEPVKIISTRRPFDSPYGNSQGTDIPQKPSFYYRLIKNNDAITAKRHMPYPFGEAKYQRLTELFYQADFTVDALPDYQLANAANPFKTFQAIPNKARYQFLLDQAQFSIMNFMKGPVCRGQVALNVIDDNFWVFFLSPDNFDQFPTDNFIEASADLLEMPASTSDKALSLRYWRKYAKQQQRYVQNKLAYLQSLGLETNELNLDLIWSGEGNPNATLTIFRHFDSASVTKGFVGPTPKTAWLISYPILERIHYLLVAGFDVYGNLEHQLTTRLYMDFLRMEAESNFISLLPKAKRKAIHEYWYRDTSDDIKAYIFSDDFYQLPESGITYTTDTPQLELLNKVAQHTNNSAVNQFNLTAANSDAVDQQLAKLNTIPAQYINILPQVSFIMVSDNDDSKVYSLLGNAAHSNVAHLFSEDDRRLPAEDSVAILRGIVGSYPNAFFAVDANDLDDFITRFTAITSEHEYRQLKDRYAIRRTNQNFWAFADKLHAWYFKHQPESAGLLDFNRLENR